MPDHTPLAADAEFVAHTASAYESDPTHYVEKFRRRALADEFGDAFVERLPTPPADDSPCILDVGCGPGADSGVFAERGFETVGFDISESLLRAASDHVPTARFVRGDMRSLPFDAETFDGLWSSASFLHIARGDASATLDEFARVLRDDGVLFLSVLAAEPHDSDAVETEDGRRFTFWEKAALDDALSDAGFEVAWDSGQSDWHALVALRE